MCIGMETLVVFCKWILKYPHELHDLHDDYPLAPEGINLQTNMLYQPSWSPMRNKDGHVFEFSRLWVIRIPFQSQLSSGFG